MCYIELGKIDPAEFDTDLTVLLKTGDLGVPSGHFRKNDEMVLASQINVGICFGVSAISLDAYLDRAGVQKDPTSHRDSGQVRTIMYMLRCAFAHSMSDPRWKAHGAYASSLSIDTEELRLSVDLRALHDHPFEYEHIGGITNWFQLREIATKMTGAA